VDRYPTMLGSQITAQYITSAIRMCMSGYRREYVDLLDEMLVGEPTAFACLTHRINSVSSARLIITPAKLRVGHPDADLAKEIADDLECQIDGIPEWQSALGRLLWGNYYGVSATEILWDRTADGWTVVGLDQINSRRLSYPDSMSWQLRIWDQAAGVVEPGNMTTGMYGLAPEEFPNKFIIFQSSVRGDYPTREGLGLQLLYWFGLKGVGARGWGQFIERFGKPWVHGKYSTAEPDIPKRAATPEDIQALDAALAALGSGFLSSAALPDSVDIQLDGPGLTSAGSTGTGHEALVKYVDQMIEEVILTQSGTTTQGPNGSRAGKETMKESTRETFRFDARCLADVLQKYLISALMRLRWPGLMRLAPKIGLHVEKQDPLANIELAAEAAKAGLPVDADKVAAENGIPLIQAIKGHPPRRMYPVKPVEPYDLPIVRPPQDKALADGGDTATEDAPEGAAEGDDQQPNDSNNSAEDSAE